MTQIHQRFEIVHPDTLKPHPKNARRGNVDVVADSFKRNGQFKPIVANSRNQTIIAGHHMWRAALALGWTEVSVLWVDVDEKAHRKMMLIDNRSSDVGDYDMKALEDLLNDVAADDGLAGTGYSEGDLARMFGRQTTEYDTDPDEVPEVKGKPRAAVGDVWALGPHRLAVGDSTDHALIGRLMDGQQADVMWTDPPYGVSYVGGTGLTIQNDGADEAGDVIDRALEAALTALRPGAPVYIAHSEVIRLGLEESLRGHGYLVRQNLIWVKNSIVLGRSDYQYRHEPILEAQVDGETVQHEPVLYGFTPGGSGRLGRGGPRWYGNNAQSTVLVVDKPRASAEHPTMKPVDLIVQMLRNSAPPNGLVLDIFGGSGSTMVAADSLGLRACLVELDPHYADVICARYERLTGVPAEKVN